MFRHVTMRRFAVSGAFVGLLLMFVFIQQRNRASEARAQRVLYAGNPGSPRMQEFVGFLKNHFAEVGTCDLQSNFQDAANSYDVVIADWTSVYKRDANGKMLLGGSHQVLHPKLTLDASFSKPMVMIGTVAGHVGIQRHLAIDWKCLCLENYAHDTDTNHPIFKGPLPVNIEWQTIEKPFDYFTYPGSKAIDEKLKVWKVQAKNVPLADPGIVSARERFTATANAEAISGGINGKGPTSVAIGRHGNFFLWGFSGSPSELTESAKAALINSIHYMKAFDGQTPSEVDYEYSDRDLFLGQVYQLRMQSPQYADRAVKKMKQTIEDSAPSQSFLAQLGDDPANAFQKSTQPIIDQILTSIPTDVRGASQDDPEKLIAYYTDNLEYLTKNDDGQYVLDQDLKELGLSNRTNELLSKCIQMLEADKNNELATKILRRYAGDKAQTAQEWRDWYDRSGKQMKLDPTTYRFYAR